MLHPADKRREGSGRRPFSLYLWLILITLLLLVLDEAGVLSPVKGQVIRLLTPAQRGLARVRASIGEAWDNLGGADELREENAALHQQVANLEGEIVRLKAIELENDRLRQSLDMKQRSKWQTLPASVISGAEADRKAIFIDRGSQDGVAVGMVVVGQEGGSQIAMVGVVEAVFPQNAQVLLITDYRSVISAQVLHSELRPEAHSGEIEGRWQLGSYLMLNNIDRDATIAPGDLVVTAGLSKHFSTDTPAARIPADVPIGIVDTVKSLGHAQEATVRPFLNPDRVRSVWVIVDND